jgi:hypothetical protein
MTFNSFLATFSFFVFVIGLILTYLTSSLQAKLSSVCVSKKVHTGLNIILILSIMMTVFPLVQLFCHLGCECPPYDINYKSIVLTISIILTITSSIVLSSLKNNCNTSPELKYYMIGLLSTCVIVTIGLTTIMIVPIIKMPNKLKGNSNSSSDPYEDISSGLIDVGKEDSYVSQWE